jgi:hypothetical protein
MRMSRFQAGWWFVLAAGMVCFTAAGAQATRMVRLSTEQMAQMADLVVVGRVLMPPKAFVGEQDRIFSRVTVGVEQYVKGAESEQESRQLELVLLGGTLGGRTTRVVGMPTFEAGERAVLFLRQNEETKKLSLIGLSQGKKRIVQDSGGREYVHLDPEEPAGRGDESRMTAKLLKDYLREIRRHQGVRRPWVQP